MRSVYKTELSSCKVVIIDKENKIYQSKFVDISVCLSAKIGDETKGEENNNKQHNT